METLQASKIFKIKDAIYEYYHGSLFDVLPLVAHKIDHIYTDPPWTRGNLTYFENVAEVGRSDQTFQTWLRKYVSTLSSVKGHVFIEMGKGHISDLAKEVEQQGGQVFNSFTTSYYGGNPNCVCYCSFGDTAPLDIDLEGLPGPQVAKTISYALAQDGITVADPCLGTGMMATWLLGESIQKQQFPSFIGIELSSMRLGKAVERMEKALKRIIS
jgi:hypothetical protein